ncbi:MAG: hypothetical protein HYX97_06340, partial [Chloroflexi bacterium]|nr:hypothetical protein [Chloroflexota bacterium]
AYKVDLKSMSDKSYRQLGGKLDTVLSTIRLLWEMGFWVEIVTLVVPGFNDTDDELRNAADFLATVSPDIPWHITAYHQDYKMLDHDNTTAVALLRAARIGKERGLRYVYAGNLPGQVSEFENTYCPACKALLVERVGFTVYGNALEESGGHCPSCSARIPGIWTRDGSPSRLLCG